ncbi:MAG: peptide deformylase [Monoglobales bacterium]
MALRQILTIGEDVLYKRSREVTKFDDRLSQLIDDMIETMHAANGVGLAAVQIGILKRAVVVDTGDGVIELVNPEIVSTEGVQDGPEGCLSVPGRRGMVERPMNVTVKAQDRTGKETTYNVSGFTARAFCHEIDHLDGKLFVERASILENIE